MRKRTRLNPGPLTVSNINWSYASVGIIILLSDFTLFILFVGSGNPLVDSAIILFFITGIVFIWAAFSRNTNSLYLIKGRCNILEGSIRCGGGCKKCSFAHAYLQQITDCEDPDVDEIREYIVGEPVFIGNEGKNPEIHQSMRQYDRE